MGAWAIRRRSLVTAQSGEQTLQSRGLAWPGTGWAGCARGAQTALVAQVDPKSGRVVRCGVESSERLGRHRWKVERSLAWLLADRRLTVRYERRADILTVLRIWLAR